MELLYVNQGLDGIIQTNLDILLLYFFSVIVTLIFLLRIKIQENKLLKSLTFNAIFFLFIYIIYFIVVSSNLNIVIFSENDISEKIYFVFFFIIIYIIGTFLQLQLIKKFKPNLNYFFAILNFFTTILLFYYNYPENCLDKNILKTEKISYLPNKKELKLLNGENIYIDTISIYKDYYKKNIVNNESFNYLEIKPKTKTKDTTSYSFRLQNYYIEELNARNILDSYKIFFYQKNPDPNIGWTKPIITDTIIIKKTNTKIVKQRTNCN